MLFRIARALDVELADDAEPARPERIPVGEVVRLLPELNNSDLAHIVWSERRYACARTAFLTSTSPIGPAPD
jgi:hypothetical protein